MSNRPPRLATRYRSRQARILISILHYRARDSNFLYISHRRNSIDWIAEYGFLPDCKPLCNIWRNDSLCPVPSYTNLYQIDPVFAPDFPKSSVILHKEFTNLISSLYDWPECAILSISIANFQHPVQETSSPFPVQWHPWSHRRHPPSLIHSRNGSHPRPNFRIFLGGSFRHVSQPFMRHPPNPRSIRPGFPKPPVKIKPLNGFGRIIIIPGPAPSPSGNLVRKIVQILC